jgi:hypothetical protein
MTIKHADDLPDPRQKIHETRPNVVAAADDSLMMIFLACRSKLMVANRPRASRATRCYSGTTDGDDRPSRIALPSWSVMPQSMRLRSVTTICGREAGTDSATVIMRPRHLPQSTRARRAVKF